MLASDVLPPRAVSSRGMVSMLKRLEGELPGRYAFKLLPASALNQRDVSKVATIGASGAVVDWSWLPASARNSSTGLACLHVKNGDSEFESRLAVAPPFPIRSKVVTTDRDTLVESINPSLHVGIILIRYGYVAVAVAHEETLVVTKTETRWVPNRHRAGGQSANRFKRSREKWAREFFDKSARLAEDRFGAYRDRIDWLIFGGDRHVINDFLERAKFPDGLEDRILGRRLNTLRPNRNALKDAVRQAWSSTVYELAE